jgi:hypothetical protein
VLTTPVVLIIFKRPELTARVVHALAAVKPRTLLVVADGPRPDRADEREACAAARAVIDRVDWPCEVIRHYSDVNLGCGICPGRGITWAFSLVEEAIVLEDDTIPVPSFFRYCGDLLEKYRHDDRVMHIGGTTLRQRPLPIQESYYFSRFNVCAGSWATWRRAWRAFDPAVVRWPMLRDTTWLHDLVHDPLAAAHWAEAFDVAHARQGDVSYWDHQWTFACWAERGLSILPRTNLAANIGAGPDSTHMTAPDDPILNVPVGALEFPLRHPVRVQPDVRLDRAFLNDVVLSRLRPRPAWRVLVSRVTPPLVKRRLRQIATTAHGRLLPLL